MGATVNPVTTSASVSAVKPTVSVQFIDPVTSVAYVLPATEIEYVLLTVSAELDVAGWYPLYRDVAVVADQSVIQYGKAVNEIVSIEDVVQQIDFEGTLDDIAAMGELITFVWGILRDFDDAVGATDVATADTGLGKSETVVVTDNDDINFGKSSQDSVSPTDASIVSYGQAQTDTVSATDASSSLIGKVPTGETVTSTDSFDRTIVWSRAVSDSAPVADALSNAFSKALSDTQAVTDNTSTQVNFVRSIADTQAVTDNAVVSYALVLADGVTATDVFASELFKAGSRLNETVLNGFMFNG